MLSFYFIFKRLRKYVTFDEASTLKTHVFFSIILFETFVKFWFNLLIHKCDYNVWNFQPKIMQGEMIFQS